MKHLMTFNERMALKDYTPYIERVAKAYKDAPDFEESEKYRWDILNRSNYTFFKRLISKVEVIFTTDDKSKDNTTINILDRPFKVVYRGDEPYSSQKEMKDDYIKNKHLFISMNYSEHPVFSVIDNIVFRTVHDYIVHILADVDFSGRGEIAAFNAHSKLAPKEAIPAIFTEVVGQASYKITYGHFTTQKITVLDGFDYNNVGEVEGCDVVNKELICNESVELKSKSDKGNRYFKMLSTGMFQHYDSPKGQLSKIGGEDDRKRLVSKLSKADKKLYKDWLKTPEGKESLELFK